MSAQNANQTTEPRHERTNVIVPVAFAHVYGDGFGTEDLMRNMEVADGYGLRIETGRIGDYAGNGPTDPRRIANPPDDGKVVAILSRKRGAVYVQLTAEQARRLAIVLLEAAEVA